jgi:hypothetical protein
MSNNYNMPANNYNSNASPLMNNQTVPNTAEIDNLQNSLRSNPQFVSCPYCRNQGMTRVDKYASCLNVACCLFTAVAPWLIFQAVRGKDINCCNADHFCVRCGNKLGSYYAC